MPDRRFYTGNTRQQSKRVRVNYAALDALLQGVVNGLEVFAKETIADTHPPDAPPIGAGLVAEGGYEIFSDGRKVAGNARTDFNRGSLNAPARKGITCYVGFGFPAKFNEIGTVHQPARPFFSPVLMSHVATYEQPIETEVAKTLRSVKPQSIVRP